MLGALLGALGSETAAGAGSLALTDMPGLTAAMSLMQQKMQEPTNWWEAAKAMPRAAMQATLGPSIGGGLYDYFDWASKAQGTTPAVGFRQQPRRAASPMLRAMPAQPIVFGGNR